MSAQTPHSAELTKSLASPAQNVRCTNCGYRAVLRTQSPPCPMCQTTAWELDAWRPLRDLSDFWDGNAGRPPSAAS